MTAPTVGERVAEFRRKRGLSQRDLAAAMNRSESWVSQVERGVQPVERLSLLQALAHTLSTSASVTSGQKPSPRPSTSPRCLTTSTAYASNCRGIQHSPGCS
jgi:transcriptional regulator with XRE-family HTH domain